MFDFVLIDLGVAVSGCNMHGNVLGNLGYDTPDEFDGRNELCRWGIFIERLAQTHVRYAFPMVVASRGRDLRTRGGGLHQ